MTPPSKDPGNLPSPTFLLESDLDKPLTVALPHGIAVLYSRPHPTRDSPNQDAAAVIPASDSQALLVVADGMGGTRQGGEAAATIVHQLARQLPLPSEDQQLRTAILNGIEEANLKILSELPGSGSTLAAVEVTGDTIRPYHIGDTEILVVGQRGKLKFQSISHSLVGMGVEAGLIDEVDALHHDDRHIILNAIGSAEMRIELGAPLALDRRDTLLLASDGLTDNLSLDDIIELLRKGPLDQAVIKLAELASKRMADSESGLPSKPDDLTLLAYRRSS
ncbi:PP2C family protein-serine/threonine phosphatase [Haloferula chungangensis]|uniref:PP2C family protein-serine/threonine phosphatase n=1 Tax=Haloferula chungangensis TaxID=1048331 RepID=A0ABW2L735_9BACT